MRLKADREEYEKEWLNHCRHCGGFGYFHIAQTRWEPEDYDTCPNCTEKGICARCGKPSIDDDGNCPNCGFIALETIGDPTFDADDCICWYEEDYR
jgi:ribosomal protein L37E